MTEFKTFTESPSVQEQNLAVAAREISEQDALNNTLFATPLELQEKWRAMPANTPHSVPHYRNIDPTKIGVKILPTLFILDVLEQDEDEPDFRWRLFGTRNTQRYGIEATGYRLSKAVHIDASIAESLRLARLVCKTRTPKFMATSFTKDGAVIYQASSIILPLSDDNGHIARVFGCTDWA